MALTVFKGLGGGFTYCENLISRLSISEKLADTTFLLPSDDFLSHYESPQIVRLPINYGNSVKQRIISWIKGFFLNLKNPQFGTSEIFFYPLTIRIPRVSKKKFVVTTVFDLQHHDFPQLFSFPKRVYRKYAYDLSIKNSDHIITISNFSAKRISDVLRIPQSKITVIPLGVEEMFFHTPPDGTSYTEELGQYIYFPANVSKHKNHKELFKAFEIVKRTHPNLSLVLSGGGRNQLGKLPEGVVHLGFVSKTSLSKLYQGAEMLVFPSLYEGFGLPVLEALASGTQVVCSNLECLQEICGEFATYFDPTNHEDIAEKIIQSLVIENSDSTINRQLHASNFSWDRVADAYVKTLNKFASRI